MQTKTKLHLLAMSLLLSITSLHAKNNTPIEETVIATALSVFNVDANTRQLVSKDSLPAAIRSNLRDPYGFISGAELGLDDGKMYWTSGFDLSVKRANLNGSGFEVLNSNLVEPYEVVVSQSRYETQYYYVYNRQLREKIVLSNTGAEEQDSLLGAINKSVGGLVVLPNGIVLYAAQAGQIESAIDINSDQFSSAFRAFDNQ